MLENLPHLTIRPIAFQPNFEAVAGACLKLNTNASSLRSNLRKSLIGLLYLNNTTICNILSTVEFDPPNNPGQNPTIPENATRPQIVETRRFHRELHDVCTEHKNEDKALTTYSQYSFEETCIRSKRKRI